VRTSRKPSRANGYSNPQYSPEKSGQYHPLKIYVPSGPLGLFHHTGLDHSAARARIRLSSTPNFSCIWVKAMPRC
jgi:hypothetical protein